MSDENSIEGASPWSERVSGSKPRWHVYVAAFICASFFAGIGENIVVGGLDALAGRSGGPERPLVWYGVVTGAAAGLIWGVIFSWAHQLRLAPVVWVLAGTSAAMIGAGLYQIIAVDALSERFEPARRAVIAAMALHVAVFSAAFLALAIPPRRAKARSAAG